jgi:hypothetical protein
VEILRFVVSRYKVFQSNLYITPILEIISKKVKTSPILGTLLSFIFHLISKLAANIGKVAFFEPLTKTSQVKSLEVFILYIP